MARITLTLSDSEFLALRGLAEKEIRHPRDQAALLIRHELERLGMLPTPARAANVGEERKGTVNKYGNQENHTTTNG